MRKLYVKTTTALFFAPSQKIQLPFLKQVMFILALFAATALDAQTVLSVEGGSTGTWTAPANGGPYFVRITAKGADGGLGDGYNGGQGATLSGIFKVEVGQTVRAISGAKGEDSHEDAGGGGGGGAGAVNASTGTLLLLAGGGNGGSAGMAGFGALAFVGNGGGGISCSFGDGGGGINGPGAGDAGGGQVSLSGLSAGGVSGEGSTGGNGMGGGGGVSDDLSAYNRGGGGGQTGGGGCNGPAFSQPGGECQSNTAGGTTASPQDGYVRVELLTTQTYYRDADGDGYGDAANPTTGGVGCTPAGYVLENADCNDGSGTVNAATVWVLDADADGHYNGEPVTGCTAPGEGYVVLGTQTAGDCNDRDSTKWRTGTFYRDGDNDGYTMGNGEEVCYGVNTPAGYRTVRSATDDCEDRANTVWRTGTFYFDGDRDGYTVGDGIVFCFGALPTNYSLTKSAIEDCDEYNSTRWRSATVYTDRDGDGYTTGAGIVVCYGAALPASFTITKSALEDCRDEIAGVNPGAAEVCGNGLDDNCNGQIDEACGPCANGTNLTTSVTATSAQLTWRAPATPAQWQVQYKSLAAGSKWTAVDVNGTSRSVPLIGLKTAQRYKWQLRAKCGKSWTNWSYEVEFTTLRGGSVTTMAKQSTATPLTEETPNLVVPNLLHRNQQWRIANLPAQNEVMVMDVSGKMVFKASNYANAHRFSNISAGMYFYQIQTKAADGKPMRYKGNLVMVD